MTTRESAVVFPLLPGKHAALRQFVLALERRAAEHDATHQSVSHESWFVQETPEGERVVVYLQAKDTIEVYTMMALSKTPFACWFREQVLDLTGVDLVMLPPFSLPERVFHRVRDTSAECCARLEISDDTTSTLQEEIGQ